MPALKPELLPVLLILQSDKWGHDVGKAAADQHAFLLYHAK